MTTMCRPIALSFLGLIAFSPIPRGRGDDAPAPPTSPDVTIAPAYGDFLVIPLRVHILTASDLPEVDCHLSDADVARILGKMNGIWEKAGIRWGLEALRREPAAGQERFRVARALHLQGKPDLGVFRILLPEEGRINEGVDLYYIHDLPVNGVWFGQEALVKETARLGEVEGGIDEPIPRVSAHELGHALGLRHRQDRTNLLASGTTGTRLNAAEVQAARERARKILGAMPVADLRQAAEAAEAAGERARARRLWSWLAAIPGAEADAARTRLDRLGTEPAPKPD